MIQNNETDSEFLNDWVNSKNVRRLPVLDIDSIVQLIRNCGCFRNHEY